MGRNGAEALQSRHRLVSLGATTSLPQGDFLDMIKNFLKDETGAELAEYAVGVALLVAIGLVVYRVLGDAINESNSSTGEDIKSADYGTAPAAP